MLATLSPWPLKRWILSRVFGYEIDRNASIGLAWVFPKSLKMSAGARIDHLTVALHLDSIVMEEKSSIGRSNWITGFPSGTDSPHFAHQPGRRSELFMGREAAITKQHHIDCTNSVEIGAFSIVAGYQTQILTHSIDIVAGRQDSAPISIGEYSFVGTNSVLLSGSALPSRSVLGAKSLLNRAFNDELTLYAGTPSKAVAKLPAESGFFTRSKGYVF